MRPPETYRGFTIEPAVIRGKWTWVHDGRYDGPESPYLGMTDTLKEARVEVDECIEDEALDDRIHLARIHEQDDHAKGCLFHRPRKYFMPPECSCREDLSWTR